MGIEELLRDQSCILAECAIAERLRRMDDIELHPTLFNTPLIYDETGSRRMREIYSQYHQIALDAKLPILLYAPTWRVNRQRIGEGGMTRTLNRDAVRFMLDLKAHWHHEDSPVYIGGLIGPKNDCYSPEQALSVAEAEQFHAWQINELVEAGVDCILAQTMPALTEASGMAKALEQTGTPYIISFVIGKNGRILDGTTLPGAVKRMDEQLRTPPAAYMVNCVYPTFIRPDEQPAELFGRLLGIQANASSKTHDELEGSQSLQQDSLEDWGKHMVRLHREFGVKILGGCCGTDDTYLRYVARILSQFP